MGTKSGPDYSALTVRGIIGTFFRRLALTPSWASDIGVVIPSDQAVETYVLAGMTPHMREWVGGRLASALRTDEILGTNLPYEATLEFDRADWERDKTGQMAIRVGDLARRAARHWEKILTNAITTNGLAYDGQNFFDTDHSLGSSGTLNNAVAAAQVPALNVTTANNPTADEMVDVITGLIGYMRTYKDDRGEPVNDDAMQFSIMVPANLDAATRAAMGSVLRKSGSSNEVREQDYALSIISNPRLTTDTELYVFRTDTEMKPFILQDEKPVEMQVLGPESDKYFDTGKLSFGAYARRAVVNGEYTHAIRGTLS